MPERKADRIPDHMVLGILTRAQLSRAFIACVILLIPLAASANGHRSRAVVREFQELHPCPSTGRTIGACPGYVRDHVVPLACGGADTVENLQWAARAKDKLERKACAR